LLDVYLKELQKITLLEPAEEKNLWIAYKEKGDLKSRGRLIEQYQPLVFKEVMRWHVKENFLQDALQEGTLGLIEAVEHYEHDRNVAFPLYAIHRIRGEIIDYLNREGKSKSVSIDEPDENGMTLRDVLPDECIDIADQAGRKFLFDYVVQMLRRLPKKEQIVLESVYLHDKQQKIIARDMDLSLTYVYRLQKRGIRRVRGMLSRFIHENK